MFRRFVFAMPAILLLAGCGPTAANYAKPNASLADRDRDEAYCQAYADGRAGFSTAGLAGVFATVASVEGLFKTCMMDRGWVETRPG